MLIFDRIKSNLAIKMWLITISLLSLSLILVFYIQNNSIKFIYYNMELTKMASSIEERVENISNYETKDVIDEKLHKITEELQCELIILDRNKNYVYKTVSDNLYEQLSLSEHLYINENLVYIQKEDENIVKPFYEHYYEYLRTEDKLNVIYGFEEETSVHVSVMKHDFYGENYVIIAYKADTFDYDIINFYENYMIKMFFIILLVVSVISYFISMYFVEPVRSIERVVRNIRDTDISKELFLERTDEIGSLSRTVEILGLRLKKSDGLHKEVFSNISHELKSPIVLIAGYGELVRDITWKDDEKREEHLNLIIKEAHRMTGMINDILDYSQVANGHFTLKEEEVYLMFALESEIDTGRASAVNYGLDIKAILEFKPKTMVYIDTVRFSQILRNLFNNAINHSYENQEIIVRATNVDEGIRISIENKGDRISDIDKSLIFNRYYRSQHQNSRREGSGIGLSIVKNIYDAHGFKYGIDYIKGHNVFYFIILNDRIRVHEEEIEEIFKQET